MLLPRRRRVQAAIFVVLSVAGTLVTLLPQLAAPAAAAETASVAPLSWDVIGLDSNRPQKSTPHVFPVAARFCNTGAALTGAYAQLSLTASGNSSTIDYSGPSTGPTLNLAAGACTDAFFHVQVNQSSQSFGQTDGYTLALKDSGGTAVASRTGTLYVQKLISQNRNSVTAITSPACDSSAMSCTFATGGTYTITLWSHSAPNGFEQSESFLDLPTGYLTVDSVKTYYSVPKGYRGEGVWGNGCGWNPTTRACDGTGAYTGLSGGRVGGTSIRTVYTVTAGATAGSSTPGVQGSTVTGGLRGVIYDLSGASFHYNANATDNSKAYSVSVVKGADLGVTSSHGAMVVNTQGTYTLTVTNNGPSTLTGGTTKVVDTLPAGFTYVSASAPSGWSCSAAGATVTCNRTWSGTGSLASGAAQSITLTVKPTAAGAYVNSAAVSVDTSATPTYVDPVAANNQAADPTTVATDATQYDLQLAMAGSAGFIPGQSGTYTVTASNGGPAPTGSPVTVADTLPTGVTFRSASGTGWDCGGTAPGASTVTCTYGSALSPGASAGVLTLTVDVGTSVASGWVTDTATASSAGSGTDAYPGNDTASVRTPVSSADLSVALSDGGSFPIGGTGSFTAAVTNSAASASAAQGVRLVDTLPSGLTYNPAGTSGGGFACSASGQVVTCTRAAALDVGITVDLVLGV
ncbi:MAG TPA: DUF11 domain-containing protein, partial [Acidimicrobiales bacterium]|nr:DUF11 domain-containing protein [Acidimicrobiales bacterium]